MKATPSRDLSDFEATLAMLPPRLATRLSLDPSRDFSLQVPFCSTYCFVHGVIIFSLVLYLMPPGSGKQQAQHSLRDGIRGQLPQRWKPGKRQWRRSQEALPTPQQRQVASKSCLRYGCPAPPWSCCMAQQTQHNCATVLSSLPFM